MVQHLTQSCGLSEADAEKIVPKKDVASPRHALSAEQLGRYNATVRRVVLFKPLQTLLLLLPITGLRVAEACGLLRSKLYAEGDTMRANVLGKGQKLRNVSLRSAGTRLLVEHLRSAPVGDRYVFAGPRGGRMSPALVQKACRIVADEADLPGLTPHVLRHTFATLAIRNCWNVKTVQAAMGHGSAKSRRLPAVTLTYIDL
jgi:integrase